jgi:hypothetical protein
MQGRDDGRAGERPICNRGGGAGWGQVNGT